MNKPAATREQQLGSGVQDDLPGRSPAKSGSIPDGLAPLVAYSCDPALLRPWTEEEKKQFHDALAVAFGWKP